eukprot:COSAG06_NODE_3868_length_4816_cov_1.817469_1_plen_78_part_00
MAADETQPSLMRTPTRPLGAEQVELMPKDDDDHHHVPHNLENSQVRFRLTWACLCLAHSDRSGALTQPTPKRSDPAR